MKAELFLFLLDTLAGRFYNRSLQRYLDQQLLRRPKKSSTQSNGGHVIKLDIINKVADKTGVPKIKAEVAVEALFDAMKKALQNGERIELRGFGVFVVKPRKRGIGRNPRTGQEVAIPAGKTIRFKPGKDLQT